jgi:hypothetical protein
MLVAMCSCSLVGMQFSGMTSLRSVLEEVDKAFDSITAKTRPCFSSEYTLPISH